jgi:uncharacterized membrane protein HdeD (DUF308 family)
MHVLIAVGLVFLSVILVLLGEEGPTAIAIITGFGFLIFGIRTLGAYFLKFRHMVGGRSQFYIGILSMDLGLVVISTSHGSPYLLLLYLMGFRLITGGIDIARAMESKKNKAPWKMKMVSGIMSMATVVLGIVLFRDPEVVVDIYCIGLIISAAEHLLTAIRKTEVFTIA